MITEKKYMAIAHLAENMLHGRSIVAEYHPKNIDSIMYHSAGAQRYAKSMTIAAGAQLVLLRGGSPTQGLGPAIADIVVGNKAQPFTDLYTPILAGLHQNWIASYHACGATVAHGKTPSERDRLIRILGARAFDVVPMCVYLLYEILDLAEPSTKFDLAMTKSAEAHLAIQGILDSDG